MTVPPSAAHRTGAIVVMNPRSGDGAVDRFELVERAERLGAGVSMVDGGQSAAALARRAVARGARVLGVAGGDGTVSAVAAVAELARVPLVVIPAGTRNHFARDLGLDTRNPARALIALVDGESARVDLGSVGSRRFVNNVSFGVYAEALLEPNYRQEKARSFASVTPPYLEGRRWVEAQIGTPVGTVGDPQVVLVSNNPYQLSSVRSLGSRSSLTTAALGVIVMKRPDGPPPPDLIPRLRQDLRHHGTTRSAGTGVVTWSARQVKLVGPGARLTAGVDGEAVDLDLPITCHIRPGALQILLPRDRPGVDAEHGLREAARPVSRPPRRSAHRLRAPRTPLPEEFLTRRRRLDVTRRTGPSPEAPTVHS